MDTSSKDRAVLPGSALLVKPVGSLDIYQIVKEYLQTIVRVVSEHLHHDVPVLVQGRKVHTEVVLEPLAKQQALSVPLTVNLEYRDTG